MESPHLVLSAAGKTVVKTAIADSKTGELVRTWSERSSPPVVPLDHGVNFIRGLQDSRPYSFPGRRKTFRPERYWLYPANGSG